MKKRLITRHPVAELASLLLFGIFVLFLLLRNDTMEAIDHIIPFLKGDADMIGLVCNTIRKLFCMSDEGYEIFLMDLEDYKMELEEEEEE